MMNKFVKFFLFLIMAALFVQASVYLYLHKKETKNVLFESNLSEKGNLTEISFRSEKEKSKQPSQLTGYKVCNFTSDSLIDSDRSVVFSEIAWMGDVESSSNEWLALGKTTPQEVNISGWQIINESEKLRFFVPQRTILAVSDELAVFRRGVDYAGALKNSDDGLRLFDNNCNLIDEVFADPIWPAGNNERKITMKRAADFSWYDTLLVTLENSSESDNGDDFIVEADSAVDLSATTEAAESYRDLPINVGGINNENYDSLIVDDIAVSKKDFSETEVETPAVKIFQVQAFSDLSANDEFIKLFNDDDADVDLTNWSLMKASRSGKEYNLVSSSKFSGLVLAREYFIIAHKDYTGTADLRYSNNSNPLAKSDNVVLLYNAKGELIDRYAY